MDIYYYVQGNGERGQAMKGLACGIQSRARGGMLSFQVEIELPPQAQHGSERSSPHLTSCLEGAVDRPLRDVESEGLPHNPDHKAARAGTV